VVASSNGRRFTQFTSGGFADLASKYLQPVINDMLLEATRQCEDEIGRRLVPYTTTETFRAEGVDPDEYGGSAMVPMSIQATLGMSYAQSLGGGDLVRHLWLDQKAPKYPEMWAYSGVSIVIIRSYGGTQNLPASAILGGPEPDTGHIWFQLGTFLPVGSRVAVTSTGGYSIAIPASLVRACKYLTAYHIIRELDPGSTSHNPEQLHTDAMYILSNWLAS